MIYKAKLSICNLNLGTSYFEIWYTSIKVEHDVSHVRTYKVNAYK